MEQFSKILLDLVVVKNQGINKGIMFSSNGQIKQKHKREHIPRNNNFVNEMKIVLRVQHIELILI